MNAPLPIPTNRRFRTGNRALHFRALLISALILFASQPPALAHHHAIHPELMDRAIAKALDSPVSLSFTVQQRQLMRLGSEDEDMIWDGEADGLVDKFPIRMRKHFFRPLDNAAFQQYPSARDWAAQLWDYMTIAFEEGQYHEGDSVGAWHFFGRVSHLLQDMTAPLHVLNQYHVPPKGCNYESWFEKHRHLIPSDNRPPLRSDDPLPPEALAKLDPFTIERLQHWFDSDARSLLGPIGCPNRDKDDVRGYIEVLAWITYMRTTVWGEVEFGEPGLFYLSDHATSSHTTPTQFSDGEVPAQQNALHNMFPEKIRWQVGFFDNYFYITDETGLHYFWKSWQHHDSWHAIDWSENSIDSSTLIGAKDHDNKNARTTGRFWFDLRRIGGNQFYPAAYPDGSAMSENLFEYYAHALFPLTVRYNAGMLELANRLVTVRTESGPAGQSGQDGFRWSRKDNFGNPGSAEFITDVGGADFYFVAKSEVELTAPREDLVGRPFGHWLQDGEIFSELRSITINTGHSPIPAGGETYTAVYLSLLPPPTGITATKGELDWGVRIMFDAVEGRKYCELWRNATNNPDSATRVGGALSRPIYDWSAEPGVTYFYWVRAVDDHGTGAMSESDSGWRAFAPPANVTASKGTFSNRVRITWTEVDESAYYDVLRHTSDDVDAAISQTARGGWLSATHFDDETAVDGATYYYWVVAGRNQLGFRPGAPGGPDTGYIGGGTGWRLKTEIPVFDPDGSAIANSGGSLFVTVSCGTDGAVIRYTTDGSEPTTSSPEVSSGTALKINVPGTLRARAWRPKWDPSEIKTAIYTEAPSVATPVFTPGGPFLFGIVGSSVEVVVTCETGGAIIRYTSDGSEPTSSSPGISSGTVVIVPVPGTLKAKAWMTGKMGQFLAPSGTRTISYPAASTVATPAFNPGSGAHPGDNLEVVVTCATAGATIRYTLDGREPTVFSPRVSHGGIVNVPLPGTLKVKAWMRILSDRQWVDTMNPSTVRSASYAALPPVPMPVFDPRGGPRAAATVDVHASHEDSSAVIRYTLDGSEPDFASTLWPTDGMPVAVPVPGTVMARAWIKRGTGQLIPSPAAAASFLLDSANDGIADEWWDEHGFDPHDPPNADSIADAAGLTYREKWVAGLIPGESHSVFHVESMGIEEGPDGWRLVSILFRSTPGHRYTLQKSSSLESDNWMDVGESIEATAREEWLSDMICPETPAFFYRLRVEKP